MVLRLAASLGLTERRFRADRALCAADAGITAVTLARLAIGRSLAADYGVA